MQVIKTALEIRTAAQKKNREESSPVGLIVIPTSQVFNLDGVAIVDQLLAAFMPSIAHPAGLGADEISGYGNYGTAIKPVLICSRYCTAKTVPSRMQCVRQ